MARPPVTQAAGLHTAVAQTTAPPGGYARADNVIIRHRDVVEPRPGLNELALGLSESNGFIDAIFSASDSEQRYLLLQGTKLHYYDGAITTFSGAFTPPDDENRRMSFASIMQRAYFATANGVYRLGGQAGDWGALQPTPAGMYRPLFDFTNSHMVRNTSGAIARDRAVAFRCYLMLKDGNTREIRGPASNRVILVQPPTASVNAGGISRTANVVTVTTTAAHGFRPGDAVTLDAAEVGPPAFGTGPHTVVSVPAFNQFTYAEVGANGVSAGAHTYDIGALAHSSLRVLLPSGVTTSHVLRVFRSETSASAATTPSDDTYQIFEGSPSAGDLIAGYMTVTDNTPEVLLGPISYFSPSADGLAASNESPPFAKEVAAFGGDNGRLMVGNVREPHRVELAILATGGASGIAAADTLTFVRSGFSTFVITWGTTLAAGTAVLYSAGSVASDIERSALSLVDAINAYASNTFLWARYISGPDDAPGRILLEARDCGTDAFTVQASARGGAFNPVLTAALSSAQARFPNRVRWAPGGQPDAFWENNKADLGAADEELLRIMPLRENVIAIKERSAFLGSPSGSGFSWIPLEVNTRFFGADTAQVLDNQVLMLSTSGLTVVSESGVSVISPPVGDLLDPLFLEPPSASSSGTTGDTKNLARRVCFAVVKPTDSLYLLALPAFDGMYGLDAAARRLPERMLCWNALSRTWSNWAVRSTCGAWDPQSGVLVIGSEKKARIHIEQRRLGQSSFVLAPFDRLLDVTINSINTTAKTVTLANSSGISEGDVILQSVHAQRLVTAVDHANNRLTLASVAELVTGAASLLVTFESVVEWLPFGGEDPAGGKSHQGVQLHFKQLGCSLGEISVGSELAAMQRTKVLTRRGWGATAWGTKPWGDRGGPRNERALVKPNATRGAWLKVAFRIRDGLAHWKLQGMTPIFEPSTDRTKR